MRTFSWVGYALVLVLVLGLGTLACSSKEEPSPAAGGSGASGGFGGGSSGSSGSSGSGGSAGSAGSGLDGGAGSGGLPTTDDGFTLFEPSSDSRVIYVSSSEGDDTNDGLSEQSPLQSVSAGLAKLRHDYPDHLLFKRGDVFDEGLGGWNRGGRSPTERMVIGAYGEGERPRFDFDGPGIFTHGGVDGPPSTDNLAFVSLHFNATNHDITRGNTSGPAPECINWLRPAADVLWEDVRFQYCGVTVQAELPGTLLRWRFFRSQFLDAYSSTDSHSSCIFLSGVTTFSIEESTFDVCGWHPEVPAAVPTIFNHCIYWQKQSATDGVVRGNIILRGASHGVQMRSAGKVLDNVFARNAIMGFLADDIEPGVAEGVATGNVFLESEDTLPRQGHPDGDIPRGWGFELLTNDLPGVTYDYTLRNNIFSHCLATGSCATAPTSFPNADIGDNIAWDWQSQSSAELQPSSGPFADPDRTLASYNASIGGDESFEAFVAELRLQRKGNFRPDYTAPAIAKYIRDGFAPAP